MFICVLLQRLNPLMFGQQNYIMFGSIPYSTRSRSQRSSLTESMILSPEDQAFRRKVNHIARLNLKDQDVDICACQECIYARQLNRKRLIHLDLSKDSSYRNQFKHRSNSDVNPAFLSIDYDRIQHNNNQKKAVVQNSAYLSNFTDRYGTIKPQKHHPNDELKFLGPVKAFSSYKQQFPAFKNNANPYIKPVEVSVPNQLKLKADSSYKSQFNQLKLIPIEKGKPHDNLRSGKPWTGASTYQQLFTLPQTIQVNRSSVSGQSRLETKQSNYKHQYQTSYRNHYLQSKKHCQKGNASDNPLLQALQD